jgi:hypothetical protein
VPCGFGWRPVFDPYRLKHRSQILADFSPKTEFEFLLEQWLDLENRNRIEKPQLMRLPV